MKTIVMQMHRDWGGQCWADSPDLPGDLKYTALGQDFTEVMDLVREAVDDPTLLGFAAGAAIDVRWQWCDDSLQTVKAARLGGEPTLTLDKPCPCARREDDQ